MKQYKCVPGPKQLSADKNGSGNAIAAFADIINSECGNGWTYHSMETITVVEQPGCMQSAVPVNFYMLIFEKDT